MSERLRESLSALMDDEADDLELGRILRAMDSGEADLAATWSRYQLVSAVLKGHPGTVGLRPLALDLEQADAEPTAAEADPAMVASEPGMKGAVERGRGRRALGSFAVAASLTAVAVVGWQWQNTGPDEGSALPMTASAPLVAPAMAPASTSVPPLRPADQRGLLMASEPGRAGRELPRASSSSMSAPSSANPDIDLRKQVEAYMVRHAEHNALHSRSGMMPFARMAAFDGAQ